MGIVASESYTEYRNPVLVLIPQSAHYPVSDP